MGGSLGHQRTGGRSSERRRHVRMGTVTLLAGAMDRSETLASFMAVTDSSETVATQMLEAVGWSLDQAVELFFASGLPGGESDAQLARRLASDTGPSNTGGWADPDDVRPADERYHDTLTGAPVPLRGPVVLPTALLPPLAGGQRDELLSRGGLGISPPAAGFLDPFLDFRTAAQAQAAGQPPSDGDEDAVPATGLVPVAGRRAVRGPDAGCVTPAHSREHALLFDSRLALSTPAGCPVCLSPLWTCCMGAPWSRPGLQPRSWTGGCW